jgi:Mg2+ and Co2+ transporter CorA
MLRKMGLKLERLEDDIFEGRSSEIVRDISEAKQEIINFRKIVRPQRAVLRDLERTKQRYLQEELEIYFDDISTPPSGSGTRSRTTRKSSRRSSRPTNRSCRIA